MKRLLFPAVSLLVLWLLSGCVDQNLAARPPQAGPPTAMTTLDPHQAESPSSTPIQTPTPLPAARWPASGRYAVQSKSQLSDFAGRTMYPQLAFIDVYGQMPNRPAPQFQQIVLLTDQGEIPATVNTMTESPSTERYRLFTLLLQVDGLQPGLYSFTKFRYVDEDQSQRTLAVGDWVIEVLDGAPPTDVEEISSSIGATSFGRIETTIRNLGKEVAVVDGLHVALPGVVLQPTLTAMSVSADHATALPDGAAPAASEYVTGTVTVAPGQTRDIAFLVEPSDLSMHAPFVLIKPLLIYHVDGGAAEQLLALPNQLYFTPFQDDLQIVDYLKLLPSAAYHPFGKDGQAQ